ncbi:DMT family transporter [Lentiprolixibacter aurantiacus]|uniref:DMT family transporter n=1 Tax=Lentiprolixibacter aurantiacus TaxID=2993939 RepID=A0AAE3MKB8_9FLAO|nr:DMT family transporter [Lentiprolixibacter aurantiacus]MCX2719365.1 DMT family transporter [Lentiprolixibacter aurantiacus]
MLDLLLSILCSSFIFVVFKLYAVHRVETLYAIIVNYLTACLVGLLFYRGEISLLEIPSTSWFPVTLILGVLFILIFNLMARTSQVMGVSVASVATKMSLVIPVILGILVYREQLGWLKWLGIALALGAVILTSMKDKTPQTLNSHSLWLPLLVFLGSGIIDSSIKYLQEYHVGEAEFSLLSATIFASAAFSGVLFVLFKKGTVAFAFNFRNILGGVALGVPNFFSIYFLLRALQNNFLNSASIFTLNNVAIVMLTTLLGIALFREQISIRNWGGIALAVTSIILIALF